MLHSRAAAAAAAANGHHTVYRRVDTGRVHGNMQRGGMANLHLLHYATRKRGPDVRGGGWHAENGAVRSAVMPGCVIRLPCSLCACVLWGGGGD
jgi:hypothetical protein